MSRHKLIRTASETSAVREKEKCEVYLLDSQSPDKSRLFSYAMGYGIVHDCDNVTAKPYFGCEVER